MRVVSNQVVVLIDERSLVVLFQAQLALSPANGTLFALTDAGRIAFITGPIFSIFKQ